MTTTNEWDDGLTGEEKRELQFAVGWVQANIQPLDPIHRRPAPDRERAARMFYTYLKSRGWRLVRFDHPEAQATDRITALEQAVKALPSRRPLTEDPDYQRLVHMVRSMVGRAESSRRFAGSHADAIRTRLRALEMSLDTLAHMEDRDAKDIRQIAAALKAIGEHFYAHQHTEAPGEIDLDKLSEEVKAASVQQWCPECLHKAHDGEKCVTNWPGGSRFPDGCKCSRQLPPVLLPAMASPDAVALGCGCAPRTLQQGCPVHQPLGPAEAVALDPADPADWFGVDRVRIDTGQAMDKEGKVFTLDPATGHWGWR